ncbi:hypothetical protein SKAU_G00139560 [Synaphobranchus kaupii]|uniref:Uncharacterized protein n=1 Tax=Synaphobranchus kaupii TaxID=118154 RepID=A0A9Q1FRZ8_SYNKA|nr:hypothetical protein SKAU_G00139560 [Synaphobranchus kaupii]
MGPIFGTAAWEKCARWLSALPKRTRAGIYGHHFHLTATRRGRLRSLCQAPALPFLAPWEELRTFLDEFRYSRLSTPSCCSGNRSATYPRAALLPTRLPRAASEISARTHVCECKCVKGKVGGSMRTAHGPPRLPKAASWKCLTRRRRS